MKIEDLFADDDAFITDLDSVLEEVRDKALRRYGKCMNAASVGLADRETMEDVTTSLTIALGKLAAASGFVRGREALLRIAALATEAIAALDAE